MSRKAYLYTVSTIFLVLGILHGVRIVNGWEAKMGDIIIPMWVSWAAVLIALYLAGRGFGFLKKF